MFKITLLLWIKAMYRFDAVLGLKNVLRYKMKAIQNSMCLSVAISTVYYGRGKHQTIPKAL